MDDLKLIANYCRCRCGVVREHGVLHRIHKQMAAPHLA